MLLANVVLVEGDSVAFDEMLNSTRTRGSVAPWSRPLWENDQFLVIDKPAEMSCEQVALCTRNLNLQLTHRLDAGTSGALLLAKSVEATRCGEALFRKRQVLKWYIAVVCGRVGWQERSVDLPLRRSVHLPAKVLWEGVNRVKAGDKQERVGNERAPQAALTHFRRLDVGQTHSLLLCRPITGRTHQIRLHAAHLQHPILGDRDYGQSIAQGAARQMLHAYRLQIDAIGLSCTAALPQDLYEVLLQTKLKFVHKLTI